MSRDPGYDVAALKRTGLMSQKGGELFTVRLKVVGGRVTAVQLRELADAADLFGDAHVHLTTRQGVEIPGVAHEHIEPLRAALADVALEFGSCGARVRTITACQGTLCTYGIIDSQAVAHAIDERVRERVNLPHKFKIGITGCPNGCIKPQENDLGIMGQAYVALDAEACVGCGLCVKVCRPGALSLADGELTYERELCRNCGLCVSACPEGALACEGTGYTLFVGGKMGWEPRLGDRLPFRVLEIEQLLGAVDGVLDWYASHGSSKERFGATIDRVGLESLTAHLAHGALATDDG